MFKNNSRNVKPLGCQKHNEVFNISLLSPMTTEENEQVTGIGIKYGSILQKLDMDFESPGYSKDGISHLITIYSKGSSLIYRPRTKENIIFKSSSLNLTPLALNWSPNFRTKRAPQVPISFTAFLLVFLDKSQP